MISLILSVAILGIIAGALSQSPIMPEPFRSLIIGLVIFAVVIWLLHSLGLLHGFPVLRLK